MPDSYTVTVASTSGPLVSVLSTVDGNSPDGRYTYVCGLNPYTLIFATVTAVNSAGLEASSSSSAARLFAVDPSRLRSSQSTFDEATPSWSAPAINPLNNYTDDGCTGCLINYYQAWFYECGVYYQPQKALTACTLVASSEKSEHYTLGEQTIKPGFHYSLKVQVWSKAGPVIDSFSSTAQTSKTKDPVSPRVTIDPKKDGSRGGIIGWKDVYDGGCQGGVQSFTVSVAGSTYSGISATSTSKTVTGLSPYTTYSATVTVHTATCGTDDDTGTFKTDPRTRLERPQRRRHHRHHQEGRRHGDRHLAQGQLLRRPVLSSYKLLYCEVTEADACTGDVKDWAAVSGSTKTGFANSVLSFTNDVDLQPGHNYKFAIQATNEASRSGYSNSFDWHQPAIKPTKCGISCTVPAVVTGLKGDPSTPLYKRATCTITALRATGAPLKEYTAKRDVAGSRAALAAVLWTPSCTVTNKDTVSGVELTSDSDDGQTFKNRATNPPCHHLRRRHLRDATVGWGEDASVAGTALSKSLTGLIAGADMEAQIRAVNEEDYASAVVTKTWTQPIVAPSAPKKPTMDLTASGYGFSGYDGNRNVDCTKLGQDQRESDSTIDYDGGAAETVFRVHCEGLADTLSAGFTFDSDVTGMSQRAIDVGLMKPGGSYKCKVTVCNVSPVDGAYAPERCTVGAEETFEMDPVEPYDLDERTSGEDKTWIEVDIKKPAFDGGATLRNCTVEIRRQTAVPGASADDLVAKYQIQSKDYFIPADFSGDWKNDIRFTGLDPGYFYDVTYNCFNDVGDSPQPLTPVAPAVSPTRKLSVETDRALKMDL
eukprot:tig00021349_g20616.t1